MGNKTKVRSVNWHITQRCNYHCKFCFSKSLDQEITNITAVESVFRYLSGAGIEKINFVGGEPILHPLFFEMTKLAKAMGFVVSVVSNGYYLNRDVVWQLKPFVDWIGLSVDSANETVETALGRGNGNHIEHIIELAYLIHQAGIMLKINTTITRLNWNEDMKPLLKRLKPERWKVFQVLHIKGQNDLFFRDLSITDEQFTYFKSINQGIEGVMTVFENNTQMIDSYFMLSPSGLSMSNREGTNRMMVPLERISNLNFSVVIDPEKYLDRGAIYDWNPIPTT